MQWVRELCADESRALFVMGGPGVGKSALGKRIAAHAQQAGARVHRVRCDASGAPPLWPFAQLLERLAAPAGSYREPAAGRCDAALRAALQAMDASSARPDGARSGAAAQ